MSDTPRTTSYLQTAAADNTSGAITAQVLRDFIVSVLNTVDVPVSTFVKTFLDDVDAATARTTLGLGTASTQASSAFAAASHTHAESDVTNLVSDLAGKVSTSDSRLSDARTPTTHHSTHAAAGSDPITISESQVTNLTSDLAGKAAAAHTHSAGDINSGVIAPARLALGTADSTTYLRGDGFWTTVTADPFTYQGTWNNGTSYHQNDVVIYNGSSYVAFGISFVSSTPPDSDSTNWKLLAQRGNDGAAGSTGLNGSNGTNGVVNPRGAYSGTNTYAIGDMVTYNGRTYVNNNGFAGTPPGTDWTDISGADGATGPQGPAGTTTPGGSSRNVQYNDAGSMAGAATVNITSNGNLNLKDSQTGDATFVVTDSSDNPLFQIGSGGNIWSSWVATGATLGTVVAKLAIYSPGGVAYLPLYDSIS